MNVFTKCQINRNSTALYMNVLQGIILKLIIVLNIIKMNTYVFYVMILVKNVTDL